MENEKFKSQYSELAVLADIRWKNALVRSGVGTLDLIDDDKGNMPT